MATAADLAIRISADDRASQTMRRLGDTTRNTSGILRGLAGAPSRAVGGLVDGLGRLGLAAMGIQAVASAAKGLGSALGIGLVSEMENVEAQIFAFTKSMSETKGILADLEAEAARTPFAFSEMATAAAALIPVSKMTGLELMKLIHVAEILGASNPLQGLEGAAFALREAASGDFVSVIERFNLSRSTLNRLKKEGVPAIEAITMALSEIGLDFSVVENLSKTMTGRWSTLQDTIDAVRRRAAKPLFDLLSTGIADIQVGLDANIETILGWADAFGQGLANAISTIFQLSAGVKDLLSGGGTAGLQKGLAGIFGDSAELNAFVAFLGKLPDAIGGTITTINNLLTAGASLVKWFGRDSVEAIGSFYAAMTQVLPHQNILNVIEKIAPLQEAFRGLVAKVKELPDVDLAAWMSTFADSIGPAVDRFNERWPDLLNNVLDNIERGIPAIAEKVKGWADALASWAEDAAPDAEGDLKATADRAATFIDSTAGVLSARFNKWGDALVKWIENATPGVIAAFEAEGKKWADAASKVFDAVPGFLIEQADPVQDWLKESSPKAVKSIEEAGQRWGAAMAKWVEGATPLVIAAIKEQSAKWGVALAAWVKDATPGVIASLKEEGAVWATEAEALGEAVGNKVVDGLEKALTANKTKALGFGVLIAGWILPKIPKTKEDLKVWLDSAVSWLSENSKPLADQALELGEGLYEWIRDTAIPQAGVRLEEWITSIRNWLVAKNLAGDIGEKAQELSGNLVDWVTTVAIPATAAQLKLWGDEVVKGIEAAEKAIAKKIGKSTESEVLAATPAVSTAIDEAGLTWRQHGEAAGELVGDAFISTLEDTIKLITFVPTLITAIGDAAQWIAETLLTGIETGLTVADAFAEIVTGMILGLAKSLEKAGGRLIQTVNDAFAVVTDVTIPELNVHFEKILVDATSITNNIRDIIKKEVEKQLGVRPSSDVTALGEGIRPSTTTAATSPAVFGRPDRIQIIIGDREIKDFIVRTIDESNRGVSQPSQGAEFAFGGGT